LMENLPVNKIEIIITYKKSQLSIGDKS